MGGCSGTAFIRMRYPVAMMCLDCEPQNFQKRNLNKRSKAIRKLNWTHGAVLALVCFLQELRNDDLALKN